MFVCAHVLRGREPKDVSPASCFTVRPATCQTLKS